MKKDALLASDMDGTVIPLDTAKEREEEIREFGRVMARNANVALAYVTGRHLALGIAGVERYRLPLPDIFVCDVGTAIYHHRAGVWLPDEGYRAALEKVWKGYNGSDIAGILDGISGLSAQEVEKQSYFKQSYYAPADLDPETIRLTIRERLEPDGIAAAVTYSVDSLKGIGLVDVLPENAAKDSALRYLWKKLGVEKNRIVYAGDSGNDLSAFVSGFNAVIVQNTPEAVKDEVRRLAREKQIEASTYFASGRFVKGVLEGCRHFNLLKP